MWLANGSASGKAHTNCFCYCDCCLKRQDRPGLVISSQSLVPHQYSNGGNPTDVRFTPESGHVQCDYGCPLSAISGHCQRLFDYFIGEGEHARWRSLRPSTSVVAVRLMTSSYFVGCSTLANHPAWHLGESCAAVYSSLAIIALGGWLHSSLVLQLR